MTLEQEIDHISLEKHPIGHLSPFLRSTLVDPQPKNNSCRDPQSKFCGVPIILSYYYDIIYLYYDKQVSPNYCSTLFYRSLLLLWSRYDILESIERHPTGDIYAIPRNLIFCAPRDFDLQSYKFKLPTPWTPIRVKN